MSEGTIEITISPHTIFEFVELSFEDYGVEEQVDQLLFLAAAGEFFPLQVSCCVGQFDTIGLFNADGEQLDPQSIGAPIRIANMLRGIDWTQVDRELEDTD